MVFLRVPGRYRPAVGCSSITRVSGPTDSVSQTLPPMIERAPTTVVAAENGGIGVDDDIVLNGGMPFDVAQPFSSILGQRQCPEGDALVEPHLVADGGGGADDHAGSRDR